MATPPRPCWPSCSRQPRANHDWPWPLRELLALLALPPEQQQALGRLLAQRLVLLAQACLLRRHAPSAMADAFIATRLADGGAGRCRCHGHARPGRRRHPGAGLSRPDKNTYSKTGFSAIV